MLARVFAFFRRFISLIAIGFLVLALILVRHRITAYHLTHIGNLILSVPAPIAAIAILLSACGYLVTTCYDRLALRYLEKRLPVSKTMLAAFVSFAVSHNVGHPLVSGTSLRYRFYTDWGLNGVDIIKIALVDSITYALGLCSLFLAAFVLAESFHVQLPVPGMLLVVGLIVFAYAVYVYCVWWWRPEITVKSIRFTLPGRSLTLMQVIVGSLDVAFAGLVLYTLLSVTLSIPPETFFVIYILSLMLGNFSQLPGGLGVFEALFLKLLSYRYPDADILAALILYRIAYYFLPLGLAAVLFIAHEMKDHHRTLRQIFRRSHYGSGNA